MLGSRALSVLRPTLSTVPFGSMWLAYGHDASVFESSTTEMLF
jgi:hypothetical protein